jgi:hypothetical protein
MVAARAGTEKLAGHQGIRASLLGATVLDQLQAGQE